MADRLSELPDDLLRRILHFAPLKVAASTTALSRRWSAPPLWLSSAAVNLETGVEYHHPYRHEPEDAARFRFFSERDAFASEAVAALDAADAPVTKLTLRIMSPYQDDGAVADFLSRDDNDDGVVVSRGRNLVDVLLSHRAARRVQELRMVFKGCKNYVDYKVPLDAPPLLQTLRVLDLTGCKGFHHSQATAVVLPGLSSLRLSDCSQSLGSLQRVIDSAPALAAIHLKCVCVFLYATPPPRHLRLRCPTANVLVLESCRWTVENPSTFQTADSVVIDAPRLRRFRYKGLFSSFLTPQPMELESVDLDLESATFWQLARSFTSTKELRLSVEHVEDVAVLTEASRVQLLPAFHRLKRLEVHGLYWTKGDAAAVAIVNLLRSCPVLTALRINLVAKNQATDGAVTKKGVRSRIIPQKITQMPAMVPYQPLRCLKSSPTTVGLECWGDGSNCFGLKLIEFFAENAMVLEELHIDEKLCEHLNHKTQRWNLKRRKSGATCFVLLPLN